jgi:hypothetical protein
MILAWKDIPDAKALLAQKHAVLARFVHVLRPLVLDVYNLPPGSVHIFWDAAGGTIAFNRAGSVFVNGRYFETWRTSLPFPSSPIY